MKNDLDNLLPFPPMNKDGYLFYYDECLYSVIEATNFVKYFKSSPLESRTSSGYLKRMSPVLSNITEFSNPVLMKVQLK